MSILQDLYPEHLLLLPRKTLSANLWSSPDTEQAFEQHVKTQPADWYYRTHPISYKYNSNNYRCPEWADIVWQDSWVIMGCSFVEGIGLAESDSLPYLISKLINQPVINLGVGGSGTDAILFNTIRLTKKNIRPKGVIIVNANFSQTRLSVFNPKHSVHIGPFTMDWKKSADGFAYSQLYDLWTTYPDHAPVYSQMCLEGAVALWKCENIPVLHINIDTDLSPRFDYARDLMHPGRLTFLKWANEIANKLQL